MITIANTKSRYGAMAMALHWIMAALILGLIAVGLYMVRLPDVGYDQTKITLYLQHKEFGMTVLFFVALRLAWRFGNDLPRLVEGLPEWQKVAARYVHLCFYALMFALPLSGWMMTSAAAIPVSFFGLFTFPDLVDKDEYLFKDLIAIHKGLAYVLMAFIGVHIGAALRHHFVSHDDTLKKMLPDPHPDPLEFNSPIKMGTPGERERVQPSFSSTKRAAS